MVLLFENISHSYGQNPALNEVSLSAKPGEILCLFGSSGCGKTTLLRLIAGLERLQSGRISLRDTVWATTKNQLPPEQRSIGFVFQDHALFPHKTVAENISFALGQKQTPDILQKIKEQLSSVGMEGLGARFPHELSGGQQQRVALARALVRQPEVLLLDEPFASVDSTRRRVLREQARRAIKASGAIAILVTHDPMEAMEIGDRIAVMQEGRVVQCGTPAEIYGSPEHESVALSFGESQVFSGEVKDGAILTAFASMACEKFQSGDRVKVVIRPDAISLTPEETSASNLPEIEDVRFLGSDYLINVVHRTESSSDYLRVLMSDDCGLKKGQKVSVNFDAKSALIFLS